MGPYKVLLAFGPNLVASEGEEWKRQRRLVAPAFSEKNNKLVWDETVRIVYDLFDNVWGKEDTVVIDNITDLTVPVCGLHTVARLPASNSLRICRSPCSLSE